MLPLRWCAVYTAGAKPQAGALNVPGAYDQQRVEASRDARALAIANYKKAKAQQELKASLVPQRDY